MLHLILSVLEAELVDQETFKHLSLVNRHDLLTGLQLAKEIDLFALLGSGRVTILVGVVGVVVQVEVIAFFETRAEQSLDRLCH